MAANRPLEHPQASICRWRTSAETLDVIEAMERMEALLVALDQRVRRMEAMMASSISQEDETSSMSIRVASRP